MSFTITFITPSIGRPTLLNTIKSVVNQTCNNWKYIIVFDGVNASNIIDEMINSDPRITSISIEKTGTYNWAGSVRNRGIDLVSSGWVGFIDDDDIISPSYVQYMNSYVDAYPEVKCIIYRMIYKDGMILPEPKETDFKENYVGISFCYDLELFKTGFKFEPSSCEDFVLLDKIRTANHMILLSNRICYFVKKCTELTHEYIDKCNSIDNDIELSIIYSKKSPDTSHISNPPFWDGFLSTCKRNGFIDLYIKAYTQAIDRTCFFYIEESDELKHSVYDSLKNHFDRPLIIGTRCSKLQVHDILTIPIDDDTFQYGLVHVLNSYNFYLWEDRKSIAFWRGSMFADGKNHNVVKTLQNNLLADARFTDGMLDRNIHSLPEKCFDPEFKFSDNFKYKYLLIFDDHGITSNHQWVFLSGAIPIMVSNPDHSYWFKKYLIPMVNYVPVKLDLSDFNDKIQWLIDNDDQAIIIMENSKKLGNMIFTSEFQKKYIRDEIDKIWIDIEKSYCSSMVDDGVANVKGDTFKDRFIDVMNDPNNKFIFRDENAGKVVDNFIILHNGCKVLKDCYYGGFSEILTLNKGCHEPAEERMFQLILKDIQDGGTMIELGSYWAFYTIWFNTAVKHAKNFCIEPVLSNLNIGKQNCALNNVTADFTQGFIGKGHINISEYVKGKNIEYIDILHSDIQGYEFEMLEDIKNLLTDGKIKYLFISTHSNELHYNCITLLNNYNYRIIASSDFETETFCYDGIIVACHVTNVKFCTYSLGNRRKTRFKINV